MRQIFFKKIFIWVVGIIITLIITISLGYLYLSENLPEVGKIVNQDLIESTKIFDKTGEVLLYEIHGEVRRTYLSHEEIPDIIRKATIAIEDNNFYEHPAFDIRGILRALWVGIRSGRFTQGGSTITQQVAKNSFLTPERSVLRKIKELILAFRLEQAYTKDEILNLYLNQIPYGHNAYGIEAASQTFFGKPAIELTLSEAAMLAAIPQAPSYFSPWGFHTTELENRRVHIIRRMKELRMIDEHQYNIAINNRPQVLEKPKIASFELAPHFVMEVQRHLNDKYGEEFIRKGGLTVITTLDVSLQKIANQSVLDGANRNTELYSGHNAALIAIDPTNGHVLSLVGSKDYFKKSEPEGCIEGVDCRFEGKFNVVTQGLRQPGSSFKPFVYLLSFINGLTPDTILFDVPTEFTANNPNCPAIPNFNYSLPQCYHPQNFNLRFRGPITLKESLAESINVTSVKALYLAGLNNTIQLSKQLGITTFDDINRLGLSLALGGGEILPIELAEAYAVLANDGIRNQRTFIIQIKDSNNRVLFTHQKEPQKIVEPNYARLINSILADRDLRMPLFGGSMRLTEVPAYQIAIKTGTTDNYVDAWTFGYTPNLVVGIWTGNNNRYPLQRRGSSLLASLPIWHNFVSQAVLLRPNEIFPKPEPIGVNIPILNGELNRENVRNILFYLNRLDDPQFFNWETAIQNWINNNSLPITTKPSYSYMIGKNTSSIGIKPVIKLISPQNGDFVRRNLLIQFQVSSSENLSKINIYLNNNRVDTITEGLNTFINYQKIFNIDQLSAQNKIKIEAIDTSQNTTIEEIIVYK